MNREINISVSDLFILKNPFGFLTCLISGIRASFEAMDLNHDGKLSANELRRACKQLGILLTREELQEIIMEADTSSNVLFILRGIYTPWAWDWTIGPDPICHVPYWPFILENRLQNLSLSLKKSDLLPFWLVENCWTGNKLLKWYVLFV